MKKRFHNKIMIASVIMVLIVSLAACGGKSDNGKPDASSVTDPSESSAVVSTDNGKPKGKAPKDTKNGSAVNQAPAESQANKATAHSQPTEKPAEKSTESPAVQPEPQPEPQPEEDPAPHVHNWVEHRVEFPVFVENIVPVYETQTVQVGVEKISDGWFWHCNCGAVVPDAEANDHIFAHLEAGEPDNGYDREHFHDGDPIYEDQQVQVGTRDESYWETESYVDYIYCSECGATK